MSSEPPPTPQQSILFVCLGNICRSPTAEGIFRHLARERGIEKQLRIASAGTGGWHVGALADSRARAAARRQGVELTSRAQQVDPARHFVEFGHLIALDRSIRTRLLKVGAPAERVRLLREYDPEVRQLGSMTSVGAPAESPGGSSALWDLGDPNLDVPDPYQGPDSEFDDVFVMIRRACERLMMQF